MGRLIAHYLLAVALKVGGVEFAADLCELVNEANETARRDQEPWEYWTRDRGRPPFDLSH